MKEEENERVRYFEQDGIKYIHLPFQDGIVQVPKNSKDDYENRVLQYYLRKYEE